MELAEVSVVAVFEELEKLAKANNRRYEIEKVSQEIRLLAEDKVKKKCQIISFLMYLRRI